ncbi:MAG: branched-subunit amino acid aminotransferase/4-amino-4-deoxychorismate lyase, partial [bacterium]
GTYVPDQNNVKSTHGFRPSYFPNASFALYQNEFNAVLELLPTTPAAIYSKALKPCTAMSNIKSSSALWYVKAGLHLRSLTNIHDLILLNEHNRVCEGLTSNVLIQKNMKWYGVAQEEGPIDGVYQRFLGSFVDIHYGTITTQQLRNADCILLTNAALGIRKVELIG